MKIIHWVLPFLLLLGTLQICEADHHKADKPLREDGPYVLYNESGAMRVVRVSETGVITDSVYESRNAVLEVVSEKGEHRFQVALHPFERQEWQTKTFDKTFVLSDLHGDMDAFVSILKAGKVMNERYEWTYGANQLMIIGDVFDRGKDVLPIFWLIYKLEAEAAKAGGQVSFLLGNHEEMVLRDNTKYVKDKYLRLAEQLGMAHSALWSDKTELGQWLRTRNAIQVTGADLFVHAGLSTLFLTDKTDVVQLNREMSSLLGCSKEERSKQPHTDLLFGNSGVLWYRGMVRADDEKYNPISTEDVTGVLKQFGVKRVFVGHTIFEHITPFQDGRIIAVNVDHEENREHRRELAVEIVNGVVSVIFESGKHRLLKGLTQ